MKKYITDKLSVLVIIILTAFPLFYTIHAQESNDSPEGAHAITCPYNGLDTLSFEGDIDWYRIDLADSTEYVISVYAAPLDTYIYLYGPGSADGQLTGNLVDSDDETNSPDPQITYTTIEPGYYYLKIAEYGVFKGTGEYTLDVRESAAPSNFITVTSPNGSENWSIGSEQTITWTSDIIGDVKIDLHKDHQFMDELVVMSNTEIYTWTIDSTYTVADDYSIKISGVTDPAVADSSDSFFSITDGNDDPTEATIVAVPHLETYKINIDGDIDWYRVLLDSGKEYKIAISDSPVDTYAYLYGPGTEDGSSTGPVVDEDDDSNGGINPLIVLTPADSGYYYLRLAQVSFKSEKGSKDTGVYTLKIAENDITPPAIVSTVPTTDSLGVAIGSNITIKFDEDMDNTTINTSTVTMYAGTTQIDGTVSYMDSIATFDPDADLEYNTLYTMSVSTGAADLEGNSITSDYIWSFTTENEPLYIELTAPNGGESWVVEDTERISWNSNITDSIIINLYKASVFSEKIATVSNTDFYDWAIPLSITAADDYSIKITSKTDSTLFDDSDSNFIILESANLTLTSPSGGEKWGTGTTQSITWTTNISDPVKVELFTGLIFTDELAITSGTDNYSWEISEYTEPRSDYTIKISSILDPALSDSSDAFTIFVTPEVPVLINPADSLITADQTPYFNWTDNSDAVKWYLLVDDNSDFNSPEINDSTTTNSFTPSSDLPFNVYYWKVKAANDESESEWSDTRMLTILSLPDTPALISPGDGVSTHVREPYFDWAVVTNSTGYNITIDDAATFDSPLIDEPVSANNYTTVISLSDGTYYWKVRAKNEVGYGSFSSIWSFIIDTSSIDELNLPLSTQLYQNYPNPFNPETTVSFDLADQSKVNISIFSYSGELVRTLVNDTRDAGNYTVTWNGKNNKGSLVAAGMYFVVMKTENYRKVIKAVMVK
ncbi:MAG: Ig-like domain-containing protein [Candidatus Delongbacteria bacterium]|nr:Ig-like domain-containing protein [Candidatus Delongbacteria bacterium]